jgi:FKBP-type peptidyl-prolyl cis-trans isomerase FkpA
VKKTIIFLCLFFTVFFLHAKGIQDDYAKSEEKARLSYAFGMIIGSQLGINNMGIEFDYNAFADGLRSVVEPDQAKISEQEAMELIEAALYKAEEKQSAGNKNAEDEFFTINGLRPEVQSTPSGLQYEVLQEGEGDKPNKNSVVRVTYTGTFLDGRPFDSSSEDDGAYIPLENVIPGWTEGLMLMTPGSVYKLYIPSKLAYGREGIQGVIPPYSTLIFLVELIQVVDPGSPDDGWGEW